LQMEQQFRWALGDAPRAAGQSRDGLTHCPDCRHALKRGYPMWRKHIVFLTGRYLVISVGFWCRNPKCSEAKRRRMFASQEAQVLTMRGSSFALEVIVQISGRGCLPDGVSRLGYFLVSQRTGTVGST
jgi:hypothetical protein